MEVRYPNVGIEFLYTNPMSTVSRTETADGMASVTSELSMRKARESVVREEDKSKMVFCETALHQTKHPMSIHNPAVVHIYTVLHFPIKGLPLAVVSVPLPHSYYSSPLPQPPSILSVSLR